MAVLDDYKKYCFDEKLIPDDGNWMRAIVAGTTLEDNLKYDFYYDQASRGYSGHGYIGLYKGKSIRAIGKLKKTILRGLYPERENLCRELKRLYDPEFLMNREDVLDREE